MLVNLIIKMDVNPLTICAITLGVFGLCFIMCCRCYAGRFSRSKPSVVHQTLPV